MRECKSRLEKAWRIQELEDELEKNYIECSTEKPNMGNVKEIRDTEIERGRMRTCNVSNQNAWEGGGMGREIMEQRQYVKKDGCDELMKDMNPHFLEAKWIASRTNAEKSAYLHYRGASIVAHMVKNLPAIQKTQVPSLGQEDPLEKEMPTLSSILAWKIPWTEKPGRRSTWCFKESNTDGRLTLSRHGETAGKQSEDFKMIQREKKDYIQKNEKAVS